ncbi:helix-turn-helix domain-containing protein [Spirilliplanes yamanashiensis]|uniref:MerR family transcriptional regulator n=1 Tax=Spirilliplanes yamanashiensis TaxID=42233 RepID=A0A8J3Y598_9ACTN|nr:helix-turn-helix domain-containing protein [Spirilliplanes yamanashiensis]MDP9819550.1 excisionase family DNA binding protein [Spirilliplanes yamanashiensis]GIJ01628.1 MerR family transcriptional regulator [Spirilliplanes yamanashiensis]
MDQDWLSVEQVAERLGLHVRTVRGYIRDGRLKAVRIGKQYRIARADLAALTGAPPPAARPPAEVSAVLEADGLTAADADRLGTALLAYAQWPQDDGRPLRLQTLYDRDRGRLRVLVFGGAAATAAVLRTADDLLGGLAGTGRD